MTDYYAFDLDDTIINTGQVLLGMVEELIGMEIDCVDPYRYLKDLVIFNQITPKDFDYVWKIAHYAALDKPIASTISFINSLPQTDIVILTSRMTAYHPIIIKNRMEEHMPTKYVHVYNVYSYMYPSQSLDFHHLSRAKADILKRLSKHHTITHFVDDLPFIHCELMATNSSITPVFVKQPWSELLAERTDITFKDVLSIGE